MEERLTDEPEKLDGGDGLPDPAPVGGEEDEDLVGLTPSRLKEELAKRQAEEERERREYERLLAAARAAREEGKFEEAVSLYGQAAAYESGGAAEEEYWAAYTEEYTGTECFLKRGVAQKFSEASEGAREALFAHMGSKIREEYDEAERLAVPLRAEVEEGMASRREAFAANRAYWKPRFLISLAVFAALLIAVAVSGSMLYSRPDILMPVLLAVFGVLALLAFFVAGFFGHKFYVAYRLAADNEKLSSTDRGKELATLERKIARLGLVLGAAPDQTPSEGGPAEE